MCDQCDTSLTCMHDAVHPTHLPIIVECHVVESPCRNGSDVVGTRDLQEKCILNFMRENAFLPSEDKQSGP